MLSYDLSKMLFLIPKGKANPKHLLETLEAHPEVQFVSYAGLDMAGNDTDERIPMKLFLEDIEDMISHGVQTDGSSVDLPLIADLNNAKVDLIPDYDVNWYIDYNFSSINPQTGLPVGTLKIPAFLTHSDCGKVGSRSILRDSLDKFKKDLKKEIKKHPYVLEYFDGIESADDIKEIVLTSATELEFWVSTPEEKSDREKLSASQELKEQYWKRTYGPVRTALEDSITFLDHYELGMEMGHKENGGVKSKISANGKYGHIMEQLEIDWKYAEPMQVADNEKLVKYVVRDLFNSYCLNTSFRAKPIEGVAGSGEHTHLGVCAKLKNGKMVNLFTPKVFEQDFLTPIGFGALMGLLKHYEVINPFISSTTDSLRRLKPGYEAPICVVTSLGKSADVPSRNRTILVGLIRDKKSPMATRFELRSPNPKSNTYLVLATCYMAMLDGIKAALKDEKSAKDLEKSISKVYGEDDFYLEKDREYRTEKNIFSDFTEEEREKLYGKAPKTVWENLEGLDNYPEKLKAIMAGGVFTELEIASYKKSIIDSWAIELHSRRIPDYLSKVRDFKKLHIDGDKYSEKKWVEIDKLRKYIAKNSCDESGEKLSLLTRTRDALDEGNYDLASDLEFELEKKMDELEALYTNYQKNLF